jgi:CHAT domain-containing protein
MGNNGTDTITKQLLKQLLERPEFSWVKAVEDIDARLRILEGRLDRLDQTIPIGLRADITDIYNELHMVRQAVKQHLNTEVPYEEVAVPYYPPQDHQMAAVVDEAEGEEVSISSKQFPRHHEREAVQQFRNEDVDVVHIYDPKRTASTVYNAAQRALAKEGLTTVIRPMFFAQGGRPQEVYLTKLPKATTRKHLGGRKTGAFDNKD